MHHKDKQIKVYHRISRRVGQRFQKSEKASVLLVYSSYLSKPLCSGKYIFFKIETKEKRSRKKICAHLFADEIWNQNSLTYKDFLWMQIFIKSGAHHTVTIDINTISSRENEKIQVEKRISNKK